MFLAFSVWHDTYGVFGANAIFIPNRDAIQTNLTGQDIRRQCDQDVCGCWTISAGAVLEKWRSGGWPGRLEYDYGVYVVDDMGDHDGKSCGSEALDKAVAAMQFEVTDVQLETEHVTGLGYSLEHNPDFRYCADKTEMKAVPTTDFSTYWLPGCGLTFGASGGPWVKDGKIVSINSWSFRNKPGMGGPVIQESAARCLINAARHMDFKAVSEKPDGEQGIFVTCYDRPCIPKEEASEVDLRRLRGNGDGRMLCED